MGWGPRGYLEADGAGARAVTAAGVRRRHADAFDLIDAAFADRGAAAPPPADLPFASGFIGYLGYGLRHQVERLPATRRPDLGSPAMWLGWYDGALVWDHADDHVHVVGRGRRGTRFVERVADALRSGRSLADAWPDVDSLALPAPADLSPPPPLDPLEAPEIGAGVTTSLPRERYVAAVERARAHIRDGDIYVINLSQQIHMAHAAAPLDCYRALTELAPVPYAGWIATGAGALLAASPERFLSRRGDVVETRPIKGTRARGSAAAADAEAAAELLASRKERSELTMIVDLCRNDLGRVAETGTVEVVARRELESFRTVHQAVATVRARQRSDTSLGDLLRATFPAGSVTGCPKVSAMRIIDELETVERGPYTGAYGWFDQAGDCDLAMTIRTALWRGGGAAIGAGGGIVAESDPEAEWEEAVLKARALLEATRANNAHR